ncbi:MAG: type II secretion system GspH family protein [Candidatus Gastranaerophilales bacterium]|nr:type II secretion system GspH family protein [Candidatus Gastranaerophilales bacterium]
MKKIKAFTLAEVLTVLGLLGIIAALTVPFLIQEFNKNKWAVTYQRSFAETFNVLGKIALEEDCAKSLTCTHVFDDGQAASTKKFGDAMARNMAVAQNCRTDEGDCFSHKIKISLAGTQQETLQDTMKDAVAFQTPFYTFKTVRGVSYAVLGFGLECLNEGTEEEQEINKKYIDAYVAGNKTDPANQMLSLCGFIIIDVNGNLGPNVWGRDVFGMWVTDRSALGIYPFGGENDKKFYNKCSYVTEATQDTRGCAAQLIKDGWKMKY